MAYCILCGTGFVKHSQGMSTRLSFSGEIGKKIPNIQISAEEMFKHELGRYQANTVKLKHFCTHQKVEL